MDFVTIAPAPILTPSATVIPPKNLCVLADVDIISDHRRIIGNPSFTANTAITMYRTILTNTGLWIYNNRTVMINL
mgnify:CR=1 FL=1